MENVYDSNNIIFRQFLGDCLQAESLSQILELVNSHRHAPGHVLGTLRNLAPAGFSAV